MEIKYIKIHPAIGVARIANNEDYFEFFEAYNKNFKPASDYMSEGNSSKDIKSGFQRLKRQAVQFRAFAYGSDNKPIGEVKDILKDVKILWSAKVSNRKLLNYASRQHLLLPAIAAEATTLGPPVELNGIITWKNENITKTVNLGSITGRGLFIPAKGGLISKALNAHIDSYHEDRNNIGKLQNTDTTCDGEISIKILDTSNHEKKIPIVPAWVVSAPAQHCLTLTPARVAKMNEAGGEFEPYTSSRRNENWIENTKSLLSIEGELDDPTGLDILMMETLNGEYNPGMEVNIEDYTRTEFSDASKLFYPRGEGFIGKNEIRVKPNPSPDVVTDQVEGTIPGQLTSGLCSTWQGDMILCLNYWTAENPKNAYDAHGNKRVVIYQKAQRNLEIESSKEINEWMDFCGIVDYKEEDDDIKLNLVYDPNRDQQTT